MSRPIRSRDEEALRARLRREAEATRPAFSETLHETIWRVVRKSETSSPTVASCPATTPWLARWLTAAVAAAGLLAGLIAWQAGVQLVTLSSARRHDIGERTSPHGEVKPAGEPEADADLRRVARWTSGATEELDSWLNTALAQQRWAYLDHDAQLALEALRDSFPFSLASSSATDELLSSSGREE